jgi:hypothetical protein
MFATGVTSAAEHGSAASGVRSPRRRAWVVAKIVAAWYWRCWRTRLSLSWRSPLANSRSAGQGGCTELALLVSTIPAL